MSLSEIGAALQRMRNILESRPQLVQPVGTATVPVAQSLETINHVTTPSSSSALCDRRGASKPPPLALNKNVNSQMFTPVQHRRTSLAQSTNGGPTGGSSVFERLANKSPTFRTPNSVLSKSTSAVGSNNNSNATSSKATGGHAPMPMQRRPAAFAQVKVPEAVKTEEVRDRIRSALGKPQRSVSPQTSPQQSAPPPAASSGSSAKPAPQIFAKLYDQARRHQQEKDEAEKQTLRSPGSRRGSSPVQQPATHTKTVKTTGWRAPPSSTAPSAPTPQGVTKPKVGSGSVWARLAADGSKQKTLGSVATVSQTGGLTKASTTTQRPPGNRVPLRTVPKKTTTTTTSAQQGAAPKKPSQSTAVVSRLYASNQAKEKKLEQQREKEAKAQRDLAYITVQAKGGRRGSIVAEQQQHQATYTAPRALPPPALPESKKPTSSSAQPPPTAQASSKPSSSRPNETEAEAEDPPSQVGEVYHPRAHTRAEALELQHKPSASYSIADDDDDDPAVDVELTSSGTWTRKQRFEREEPSRALGTPVPPVAVGTKKGSSRPTPKAPASASSTKRTDIGDNKSDHDDEAENAGLEPVPPQQEEDVVAQQSAVQAAIEAMYKSHLISRGSPMENDDSDSDNGEGVPNERVGTGRPDIVEGGRMGPPPGSGGSTGRPSAGESDVDAAEEPETPLPEEEDDADDDRSVIDYGEDAAEGIVSDPTSPDFRKPFVPPLRMGVVQKLQKSGWQRERVFE